MECLGSRGFSISVFPSRLPLCCGSVTDALVSGQPGTRGLSKTSAPEPQTQKPRAAPRCCLWRASVTSLDFSGLSRKTNPKSRVSTAALASPSLPSLSALPPLPRSPSLSCLARPQPSLAMGLGAFSFFQGRIP